MNRLGGKVRSTVESVGVCGFLAIVLLFVFFEPARTEQFWIGDRGWLEVIVPGGAFAAASTAAWLAYLTYQANQRKELADRYRAASELLGSDRASAQTAGIKLLATTAQAAPDEYLVASAQTLVAHVSHLGSRRNRTLLSDDAQRKVMAWPDADAVEMAAVIAAGRLAGLITDEIDRDGVRYKGRLVVENALLKDRHMYSIDCRNVHFVNVAVESLSLEDSDLRGTIFEGRSRSLYLKNCDLRGCEFRLTDRLGGFEMSEAIAFLAGNDVDGATIWHQPVAQFIAEQQAFDAKIREQYGRRMRIREG